LSPKCGGISTGQAMLFSGTPLQGGSPFPRIGPSNRCMFVCL
jgi:hypothetical protein